MEDDPANLHLLDEEEDAFQEDTKTIEKDQEFSMVGTCLTESVVHFRLYETPWGICGTP